MPTESVIEAVENRKTGKLFILLDESNSRYKLISPTGETMNLPFNLFNEEPIVIEESDFATKLTEKQIQNLTIYNDKMAAQAEREAEANLKMLERQPQPAKEKSARKARRKTPPKVGPPVAWTSTKLTFFRHKIEPLPLKQTLTIDVNGTLFKMTKEQFLANFNDVVMSDSYRQEGLFSYSEIPEKANKYIKK